MKFTRRRFCRALAGSGLAVPLSGLAEQFSPLQSRQPMVPFRHGIASGDPDHDRVILWTRVTPQQTGPGRVAVKWRLATDPSMFQVVAKGVALTDASRDFTVKVDATGLRSGTTYYYQFHALGQRSPVGRTKTLPQGSLEQLRIAFTSCSNYPYGYFNVYGLIARRHDLDAVLHLGDYIYEYGNAVYGDGRPLGRVPQPDREVSVLEDYRQRYAQYRTDPNLQAAHRQHPFISVWDDHEFANDAWSGGAENHDPELGEGDWQARKQAAIQAYYEWMPIRPPEPARPERIYRRFQFGDLVDLMMLDTRLIGRDRQAETPLATATLDDPDRTLLGAEQERWLFRQLQDSWDRGGQWRLLGQQVLFGQLRINGIPFSTDPWDGYAASRRRVLDFLEAQAIDNTAILTGDIHSSWALEISADPYDPVLYDRNTGEGSVAVELVTPAVSSPGIEDPLEARQIAALVQAQNPHVKWVELNKRGYVLLDITPERIQAEWYHAASILEPDDLNETLAAVFTTYSGSNQLRPGADALQEAVSG